MSIELDRLHFEKVISFLTRGNFNIDKNLDRLINTYYNLFNGYDKDESSLTEYLIKFKTIEKYSNTININNIPFSSFCEHHFLKFEGFIDISYIPKDYILGFDRFFELVNINSRKLQLQEKLGNDILNSIVKILQPLECIVKIKAKHDCICIRGFEARDVFIETISSFNF
jgi:GTP cyclohydrolase I